MDLNYIRRLIKMLSESEVDELEIEEEGSKIRNQQSTTHFNSFRSAPCAVFVSDDASTLPRATGCTK